MFLSQAGRLEMTNAVIIALPMFQMGTYLLPKTVIEHIDKYRKYCLWRGSDINAKNPSKAARHMVCLPKDEGGLGVINLKTQNEALLLKNLHKFFNKTNTPWVNLVWEKGWQTSKSHSKGSFWWSHNLKLLDTYKGMALVNLQNGSTCLLWFDLWGGQVQRRQYPELFSFVRNKQMSFKKRLLSPFIGSFICHSL
jgi:hypothetical protein